MRICYRILPYSVADPDLELGGGGGSFVLLSMPGYPPSVISFFFLSKVRGEVTDTVN